MMPDLDNTLDDAYANGPYIDQAETYPPRWAELAAAFRADLAVRGRAILDVPYGDGARHKFDLLQPEGAAKGVFIFVHGGYWLAFDKSSWSHLAAGPLARGWAVAMPSYDLCPAVRIADITAQIAKAVTRAATEVSGPIALAGHSAGGHLVARMVTPGVLPTEVAKRVAKVVPISPVADLRSLLQTSMNAKFQMTMQDAERESPVLHPAPIADVTVWVGANERPAFLDQAAWLAQAWNAPCVIDPEKHHFDVIDGIALGDSELTNAVIGG